MNDMTSAMTGARLHDVRAADANRAVGQLKLSAGQMARCVAVCENGTVRAQLQLMPVDEPQMQWQATQAYLDDVVARVSGAEIAAGHCPDEGVIYLEVQGSRSDADQVLRLLTALGRATLDAAVTLSTDAELAETYLRIRGGTGRETNTTREGR